MRASCAGWLRAVIVLLVLGHCSATLRADDDEPAPPARESVVPEADPARAPRLAERDALWNEARELLSKGDAAGAEASARDALSIEQDVLRNDDPELISTLKLIAECQEAQAAWDRAKSTRDDILQRTTAAYGESDYRVVDAQLELQQLARLQELTAEQRRELQDGTSLLTRVSQLEQEARYSEAIPLATQVLETHRNLLGTQNPEYLDSLVSLASLYDSQGDDARAESLYREALEIERTVLRERHPVYASTLHNLATLYEDQADYARAELLYREALEIRKAVLGKRHPDYAISLNDLGAMYCAQGDYQPVEKPPA